MRGRPDRVRQPAGRGTGRRAVPDAGAEARGGWCVPHDRQRPRAARADAAEACMAARKRRCAVPPLCSWDNEVVSTPGASAGTGREQDAIEALTEARERTLALVASLTDEELERVHSTLMSPLVWDLGHIAAFEDLWLVHRYGERALLHADLVDVYDAMETPRAHRGDLPFLRPAAARNYLEEVRDRALEVIEERGVGDGF